MEPKLPEGWNPMLEARIDGATKYIDQEKDGDVDSADQLAADTAAQYANELGFSDTEGAEYQQIMAHAMEYVGEQFPTPEDYLSPDTSSSH
mgnify:CR=1 FL=1